MKIFPAGYVESFYRNSANNVDNFIGSDFYGKIVNDSNIPANDVQKYILATSDFSKSMQSNINHYVTKDRINNDSFQQKLDRISKNILRRQNPLEVVFEDISTFDAENPIVGSLLRERDVGKKVLASHLIKQVPGPPDQDFAIRDRLNKSRDRQGPTNNNNNILHHRQHFLFLVLDHLYHHRRLFLNLHYQFLIHFNHHHQDLIILLVIFIFLHNFYLQILVAETKDCQET